MITATTIHEHPTAADETAKLATDEERTAGGWRISFPAGIYRPIYCTTSGTIYRPERPVRVNGIPWEHAGLLITRDGTHAFQFNENQVAIPVLNRPLHFEHGALDESEDHHRARSVRAGEFDLRLK